MRTSQPARILAALLAGIVLFAPPAAAKPRTTLPTPAAEQGAQIAQLFEQVTRTTTWTLVDSVQLKAPTWHTEGIVKLDEEGWLLSSVQVTEPTVRYPDGQIIDGTDRTPGAGFGHIMRFAADGTLRSDRVLNATGAVEYHPGGLDYDGRSVWVTLAQYRPNSTATFLRVDPVTLATTPVLRAHDHYGGVVNDTRRHKLVTLNWGSRVAASWRIRAAPPARRLRLAAVARAQPEPLRRLPGLQVPRPRPTHRQPLMLCGGITQYGTFQLGGVALLDTETLAPVWEVPITMLSPAGNVVTRNPIDVDVVNGKLRLYLAPDDDTTTVLTYEAQL